MLPRQYATTSKLADVVHILFGYITLCKAKQENIYFRIVDKTSISDLSRHITLIPVFFKGFKKASCRASLNGGQAVDLSFKLSLRAVVIEPFNENLN